MLYRLGLWIHRWRWPVIVVWAILFAAAAILAPMVPSVLKSGFGITDTESRHAMESLERELQWNPPLLVAVYSSDTLSTHDEPFRREMEASLDRLRRAEHVTNIISPSAPPLRPMISADGHTPCGHTAYAQIVLDIDPGTAQMLVPSLREVQKAPGLTTHLTGPVAIFADINEFVKEDLRRAETVTLPIVFVALLLVFGAVVAAVVPVIVGVVSVTVTLAALFIVAQWTDISIFALNITSFLGLGVAIDYSLFVVSRFREEARTAGWGAEAIARAMATTGVAIAFSAVATILGLTGLLLFKFMMLRSIGIGGIAVIAVSLLISLTLIPAILSVLGERINTLTVLPRWRIGNRFWGTLAAGVMRRPMLVLLPVLAFLLLLGAPFIDVKVGAPWEQSLPPSSSARQGWERLQTSFGPGEFSPILIAVTSRGDILAPDNVGALYDYTRQLADDPRIARLDSIVTVNPAMTREFYRTIYAAPNLIPEKDRQKLAAFARGETTVVSAVTPLPVNGDAMQRMIDDIRGTDPGGGLAIRVTGAAATLKDSVDALYRDFPLAVAWIVAATYLILLILFRSVLLPLKAIVMNTLSITASYGALVFIFQQGHGREILGFTTEGFTEATAPILLFCILFGLSMDYEVFLLCRIRERFLATGDNRESVAHGLERSGGAITGAALILVLVSVGFSTGEILVLKELALGAAIAIFIDATIVRALLVPSLMCLMGNLNWWMPRFTLRRRSS